MLKNIDNKYPRYSTRVIRTSNVFIFYGFGNSDVLGTKFIKNRFSVKYIIKIIKKFEKCVYVYNCVKEYWSNIASTLL